MGHLVELACYFDREEVVVAQASLDSAGMPSFVFGFDFLGVQPDLRGAIGYRLWSLEADREAARDLLQWRPDEWAPAIANTRFSSAPFANSALLILLGFLPGFLLRGRRSGEVPFGPALAALVMLGVLLMFGV